MTNQNSELALKVENLFVDFMTEEGVVHAVKNVNLSLKRGSTLAIVGESGSGKTVTSYSILRLIQSPGKITAGKIMFYPQEGDSFDLAALSEKDDKLYQVRGGKISMIFQEPMSALSPVHTIGNQITEAILLHQEKTVHEAEELAVEMLGKVGIPMPEQRLKQYPFEFSGGMRQRVVIAMALVCKPEILIADEPTTALDVTIQAQILELINELKREMGTSVIFITHDLGVVAQVADEVAVMQQGRVVETGSIFDIYDHPIHPYTRALLASIPRVDRKEKRLAQVVVDKKEKNILPPGFSFLENENEEQVHPEMLTVAPNREVLVWKADAEEGMGEK